MTEVSITIHSDVFEVSSVCPRTRTCVRSDRWDIRLVTWGEVLNHCKQLNPTRVYLFFEDSTRVPTILPDCCQLYFCYRGRKEVTVSFPRALLSVPSLTLFEVVGPLRFLSIHPKFNVSECVFDFALTPYWLCDRFQKHNMFIRTDCIQGKQNIEKFTSIVYRGLAQSPSCFNQWLTKGLYDPRLLFKLRDFLL